MIPKRKSVVFLVMKRCFSFSLYIYIYIYICVCVCVCVCFCIHTDTHTHTHTCVHIHMYIRVDDLVVELERFGRSGKHIRHVMLLLVS